MPIGPPGPVGGGGGGGGGGGNANIGILLRQAGEDDKGIFVSHRSGDLTWHAQAEARRDAEAATASVLTIENAGQDADVDFSFPLDWAAPPETVNRRRIVYTRFANPSAGVRAGGTYGALAISWATVGAAGNSQRYRATAGTAAVAAQNAKADIEGSRGVTPDHQGVIRVTAPDATGTVDQVAGVNPRYGNNSAFLNVRALVPGTAMNGFTLNFRSVRDNSQTEQITWEATYSSDNRMLNIVATLNKFDLFGVSTEGLVDAINAARTAQGEQLVEANGTTTGLQNDPITINYLRSGDNPSRDINGLVFSGGTHAAGDGTATNRGGIDVVTSGARVAGTAATYVWQITNGRQITLTFHQVGVAGNNLQFSTREETSAIANNTVRATDSGADFLLQYRGSMTLGTIVDAMNAATSRFTVAITQGSRADSVTPSGNVSYRTSGGVDPVNPLSAVWDADDHTLTITALASDTFDEVRSAIIALSEFQIGDGTSAGDVAFEDGALTSDTIDVDSTVGESISYGFAGGTDAIPRTPLTVAERFIANIGGVDSYILDILNVIRTDTVQDVIDAYSGSRFRLAAASGSQATSTLSGSAAASTLLTGGIDAVVRRTPTWNLADNGVVSIGLHAAAGRSDNTTLFELVTAWIAATYTDTNGVTRTIGSSHHTPDTSGGGALTDPVDDDGLPTMATGGRNAVLANITEAEARPDDELDGPNILLKYDDADDLDTIIAGFRANNNGGFSFTLVYGTDGTANPEEPPFNRSFFDGGLAEAPSTGTGGLTQGQVDGRIRALSKGYALKGGPTVPDDDVASTIARDSEVAAGDAVANAAAAAADAKAVAAQDTADAALPRSGGTMTGKITLDGAPSSDLHAATKKYVDDNSGTGGTQVEANPSGTDGDVLTRISIDGTNYRLPSGGADPVLAPAISRYTLRSGDQTPVAGAIAAKVYGVDWAIAQSDHVGAARIIGFKGAYGDGTGAASLITIPAGNYAHGSGNVTIPNGVSLAADETYTLRLQVFAEGVTNPALTATPAGYQDIVITAHAAATANYHWGRLPYTAGRTAAQYASDIVFSTHDLVTGAALDTTDGYQATPDTTGTWVFYLAAKDDQTQPASWVDHNGLPASSAFEAVVDQAIGGVDYKVYVMSIQRTNADGSQTYIPRT